MRKNIGIVPMEEVEEVAKEEEDEAMDETRFEVEVVKVTLGTGISHGRKRTRSPTKEQATSSAATKKTKGKTFVSSSLKLMNIYNHHFYTKEAKLRMKEFVAKPVMDKK